MSKIQLVRVDCDKCGNRAYYGEANVGFVSGTVYCSRCGSRLIKSDKAEEVD